MSDIERINEMKKKKGVLKTGSDNAQQLKRITLKDLELGREFWVWALDNPGKEKMDWSKFEDLQHFTHFCPLCKEYCCYRIEGFDYTCTNCPINRRYGKCLRANPDSPFTIWSVFKLQCYKDDKYTNKEIDAINAIIGCYEELMAKLKPMEEKVMSKIQPVIYDENKAAPKVHFKLEESPVDGINLIIVDITGKLIPDGRVLRITNDGTLTRYENINPQTRLLLDDKGSIVLEGE